MLEESGILDEGNGKDDKYMEVDDVVIMAQSDGSASVPSASVSDKEDSVNNLNVCINLSSLSELPKFHNSPAVTINRSALDHTLSSDISNSSLDIPGIGGCGIVSNTACMSFPTIASISTTTTVAAATVATTVAAIATTTVAAAFATAATVAATVTTTTVATAFAATATTTTIATTNVATAAAVTTATITTAATITTTTATVGSTSTTTVATAATNSGTGTTVRPVYPKFGLFQFSEPVGPTQVLPASATAIKFFMQIFDVWHGVDQTNLYVSQVPSRSACYGWYDTTITEMKAFVGILLLMGIHYHTTW